MPSGDSGSRARRHLGRVDGLRACAALTVLAYHVAAACSLVRIGPLAPVFAELKGGVAVFFVISGFVLYLPYARSIAAGRALPGWRPYVSRRAARILPAYWVTLTLLAVGPLHAAVFSSEGWRYYALGQIYTPATAVGGLGPAWSLCVEVSFYAALPLFACAVSRLVRGAGPARAARLQLLVLGAVTLGGLLLRAAVVGSVAGSVPLSAVTLETALPGCLDWFAAGMALAVLAEAWSAGERLLPGLAALSRRPGWCWLLAAGCFGLSAGVQPRDLFLPYYGVGAHLGIGLGCVLLVLPALGRCSGAPPRGVARLLERPAVRWLGTVSYGVYLWHVPILQAVTARLGSGVGTVGPAGALGLFTLVAVLAVGAGAVSWYLVEQPSRRMLVKRPASPLATVAAAKTV
jgi:peptidoglycan/LPS O-acetylase OafA/YrhL